jgi:hypothetical protein
MARLKASVMPTKVDNHAKARDELLRQKSEERKAKWPNTLDATRRKKEMWKIEKQAREEQERLKIDKEEDDLQRKVREAQIKRANELLYEQSDKMKNLRSQMLYCDVIEEQKHQVMEKERKRGMERKMEEHWYRVQQQQLDEYDRKEDQELMERVQKVATTAKMQQDQLEMNKAAYIKSLQREKAEGEQLRMKAERDLKDEQEKEAAVRRKARLAVEQLRLENEKLKKIKHQQELDELAEEDKRKKEAELKEIMQNRRKAQEKKRFEDSLALKQRMIDKASDELRKMQNNEERILGKQALEVQQAQDKMLAEKEARRKKQQVAIERSRMMQLKAKQRKKDAELKHTNEVRAHLKIRQDQMAKEEQDEIMAIKSSNLQLRKDLEKEIDTKQIRKLRSRENRLADELKGLKVSGEEDEKFKEYAMNELNKVSGEGINIVPLQKAVVAKDITTLAVGGIRV